MRKHGYFQFKSKVKVNPVLNYDYRKLIEKITNINTNLSYNMTKFNKKVYSFQFLYPYFHFNLYNEYIMNNVFYRIDLLGVFFCY